MWQRKVRKAVKNMVGRSGPDLPNGLHAEADTNPLAAMQHMLQDLKPPFSPATGAATAYHSDHYLRHNARRLEHLASLEISVEGMSVLEVGAGVGEHSHYYLDRGYDIKQAVMLDMCFLEA